jgi:hypothetical protein
MCRRQLLVGPKGVLCAASAGAFDTIVVAEVIDAD